MDEAQPNAVNGKRPRGRQVRSKARMKFRRPGAQPRRDLVALGESSGPARFAAKLIRDIENDLGGRRDISRIESELIRAFAGAATRVQYLNAQLMLGDVVEVPIADFSNLASTMLRIGARLGFSRRAKPVPDLYRDILPQLNAQQQQHDLNEVDDDEANA